MLMLGRPRVSQFEPTLGTTQEAAAGKASGAAMQVGTPDSTNEMRTVVLPYLIIN
jgi:hypothetical protein